MKKYLALLLALLMLTGCASSTPPETAPVTEAPPITEAAPVPTAQTVTVPAAGTDSVPLSVPEDAVTVSTVDEFLAALGSDRFIVLAPGTYDLTTASDYGAETASPAYYWYFDDYTDGFQLSLIDIHDTVILGSGKDSTRIVTSPRLVNVLSLTDCAGLTLEGFTAGHTDGGEMCTGGVVQLNHCEEIALRGLGLYGCGTIGVELYESSRITVDSCDIYDCSVSGISAWYSSLLNVENTWIHDLGTRYGAVDCGIRLNLCDDVYFSGLRMENSALYRFLSFYDCSNITLDHCDFTGSRSVDAAFQFVGVEPVFDQCSFEGNEVYAWYAPESLMACSPQGVSLYPDIFPVYTPEDVPLPPRKQVHVSTMDEFLSAIASDTEIILDAEMLDLTDAAQTSSPTQSNFQWMWDGGLVIRGIDNFAITTEDGPAAHEIRTGNQYASVLSFECCSNITLSGFTAGHEKFPDQCTGDVLWFSDVNGLTVENCSLYGCGVVGVNASLCRGVTVKDCEIYDCRSHGVAFYNVIGAQLEGNTFRDLGGLDLEVQDSQNILVDGVPDFRAP